MSRFALCILFLAGLAATGFARDLTGDIEGPTEACLQNTVRFPPESIADAIACARAVGETEDGCCAHVHEVFGSENSCMCDAFLYTAVIESFPDAFPVEEFLDGLEDCGVALRGSDECGGGEEGPLVQQQVVIKKLLLGKLLLGKAIGAAAIIG